MDASKTIRDDSIKVVDSEKYLVHLGRIDWSSGRVHVLEMDWLRVWYLQDYIESSQQHPVFQFAWFIGFWII